MSHSADPKNRHSHQDGAESKPPDAPTFADLKSQWDIYRDYMKHEDDLLNQRTTWHLVVQGLLFTALGVALQRKVDPGATDIFYTLHQWMVYILAALAISIAALAFGGVWAAHSAIEQLCKEWKEDVLPQYHLHLPKLPGLAGAGLIKAAEWGKRPSLFLPPLIAGAWIVICLLTIWGQAHPKQSVDGAKQSQTQTQIAQPPPPSAK